MLCKQTALNMTLDSIKKARIIYKSAVASVVPCNWHRTIAGKSTSDWSVALPWKTHPTDDNYNGSNYLAKTNCWDRVASGMISKRTGETRLPLAAHLGRGKLLFQTPLSCGSIPFWK